MAGQRTRPPRRHPRNKGLASSSGDIHWSDQIDGEPARALWRRGAPAADVARATDLCEALGWPLDVAASPARTSGWCSSPPSGSRCSATTGTGITPAAPGSAQGLHIVTPGPVSAPATSCLGAGLTAPGGGQRDGLLERVPAAQAGPRPGAPRISAAQFCPAAPAHRPGCRPCWREYVNQGCVMRPAGIRARFPGWPMPGSDRGSHDRSWKEARCHGRVELDR